MGISLHPFIDKAGDNGAAGYRRPEDIVFDDGSTFARYMPSSVGGKSLRGVVVPHAKRLGGSRAFDPQNPPHKRLHVDPHIEGQSVTVDLAMVTQDIAAEATLLGSEYADKHADEVHGIDNLRLRSAAAFHLIGAAQKAQGAGKPPAAPRQVIEVSQDGAAAQDPPEMPSQLTPRTIKAASFNGAPHQPAAEPAPQRGGLLDAYQKPRPQPAEAAPAAHHAAASPPTRKVTFGVPGFGLHEAYYHDVLINDQQFILVYDERYKGGGRFLPQIDGPFAARVEGDPVDYKLVWPDQSFTDPATGRTYFQLLIEERVAQEKAP